eukprot:TRINITY_DN12266_c0_g1_i2.p1 TRINITY_DN12266_c0_g1~~TRINITY_DN12266_c0_g1_i2.p1  ORF type:complete len:203 (+),score=13.66 TRINITY_DN12266_c0_g1_i2:42-650(+)
MCIRDSYWVKLTSIVKEQQRWRQKSLVSKAASWQSKWRWIWMRKMRCWIKEALIRAAVNEAGALATAEALKKFDSEGNPVVTGGRKYTSKGEFLEKYECPYGTIKVSRHVYQSSSGGKTFCPLESAARLILNSTPAYAKIISGQYSRNGAIDAATCAAESLGRRVCPAYVRMIGDSVGELALAQENEWCYDLPQLECPCTLR